MTTPASPGSPVDTPSPYHRKNPLLIELIAHEPLTKPASGKDTRHFVVSFGGSGLTYTTGDSLAIFARNPPALVEEVLALTGFAGDIPIGVPPPMPDGRPSTLRRVLSESYILNQATKKFMTGLAERIPQGEQRNQLMEIVDNG